MYRYKFLGFSESNLKTGQVIFFCEGSDWSCDRLLRAFGDLEKVYLEYGPGAYAARLGLSFSSTIDTIVVCHTMRFSYISNTDAIHLRSLLTMKLLHSWTGRRQMETHFILMAVAL